MSRPWINSADSHMNEPEDLWSKALGNRWGDQVPHIVDKDGERFYFTGQDYLPAAEVVDFDDEMNTRIRRACEDPTYRVKCMDEDRVFAEILFPTYGLMVFGVENGALVQDCFEVYNDWLAEYCGQESDRMFGAALIYMENIDWAIGEIERTAKLGMRCAMINADTLSGWEQYQDAKYDRFWARAQEVGMPVVMHCSTGQRPDMFFFTGDKLKNAARGYLDLFAEAGIVVANEFIFGGIFDRFPDLNVVLGEFEASWIPHWLFRMEQIESGFGPYMGLKNPARPVREYLSRIYVGVIDDPLIPLVTEALDANALIWGSDFPHVRNTYLKSHKVVEEIFGHLDSATVDNITVRNAERLFGISTPAE